MSLYLCLPTAVLAGRLSISSLTVVSLLFLAKYFFGIFLYLRIIDYFRLKIDDLRNAFDYKNISSERRSEATFRIDN
jgi:hypothetical protein